MIAAILILIAFALVFWAVFFKFRWIRLTPAWAFVSSLVFIHVFIVFLIGLRWMANGAGQYLPSGEIPKFHPSNPDVPQGQYAVKILLDDMNSEKFPTGAQGLAAIYAHGDAGAWAALRKISLRAQSWLHWLYLFNF